MAEKQKKKIYTNIESFTKMKRNNYKNNMNKLYFISQLSNRI